ncbi:MAG: chorismate mutase [Spirochaetes bacterium]|nr:chorismate mutase [Spirochaetota bacterium]
MKRLYALRGATQCLNLPQDIGDKVTLLYDDLLAENALIEEDIVSLIFSVTGDLTALNPATALRQNSRALNLALFAVKEAECDTAGGAAPLPRTVRVLVHCYLEEGSVPKHVYRGGTEGLRQAALGQGG